MRSERRNDGGGSSACGASAATMAEATPHAERAPQRWRRQDRPGMVQPSSRLAGASAATMAVDSWMSQPVDWSAAGVGGAPRFFASWTMGASPS